MALRHIAHHQNNELYKEKPYQTTMSDLYDILQGKIKLLMGRDTFINASYDIDVSVEIGCQYGNQKIIDLLRREKKKRKENLLGI